MGSCSQRLHYAEGNLDLDTQPRPQERLERTQLYPYFGFKQNLDFGGKAKQKPHKLKLLLKSCQLQNMSPTIDKERENLYQQPKQERSNRLKKGASYSPTRITPDQRKSSLKSSSHGRYSYESQISPSKTEYSKTVRFAIGAFSNSAIQRSRSNSKRVHKSSHKQ